MEKVGLPEQFFKSHATCIPVCHTELILCIVNL